MAGYEKGANRERQFAKQLEKDGYSVTRSAGSHSPWDLVAVCPANPTAPNASQVLYVQVKTDSRGPWAHFGPKEREELKQEAEKAGAVPVLVWWPANGKAKWLFAHEWPS